jgi:uncharacterized protein YjbJ (UPF0337 family)
MEEMSQKVQNASSHRPTLRTHKVTVKFKGAMEEMSGKVQNASTHPLERKNHEHVHTAVGQFKGQFKGAMDDSSGKVQDASTPDQRCCHGHCSR